MRKKTIVRNVGLLRTEELYQGIVWATDQKEETLSQFIRTAIERECENVEKEELPNARARNNN
jgi:hypothetical protein